MTKASKARKAQSKAVTIDHEDIVVSSGLARLNEEIASFDKRVETPVASTAIALIPVTKPEFQPDGPVQIDDAFLAKYRSGIRAKFNAGAKFVDLIATLNLTSDDTANIEKLRVVFYDTWQECIFEKRGLTEAQARKKREARQALKRALWSDEDKRDYSATKTAWVDVRERAGLKAPAKSADATNKGQGKASEGEGAKASDKPVDLNTFDAIHLEVLDVARYLDAIVAQGAKVKTAGLLQHVADCARALRVAAHASKLEMDADAATK
jgi:hypothetical protein